MRHLYLTTAIAALAISGCKDTVDTDLPVETTEIAVVEDLAPNAEEVTRAEKFLSDAEAEIVEYAGRASQIYWDQATNITPENNERAAKAGA